MMLAELAIVAALIVLNGLLAMSELAIVSARPARLKMLIESASGSVVAEASPGGAPTSSDQFTINYLVFDRDAFSDTFERPTK